MDRRRAKVNRIKDIPTSKPNPQSVHVTEYATFGDSEDILRREAVQPQGGTINFTLKTRKRFVPGDYLFKKLRADANIDTVIYHSSVNPDKIKNLLYYCDVGNNFNERNYIDRYDWLEKRNWGKERACLFVPEENSVKFAKHRRPNSLGFTVDISKTDGDWIYGCVLEDINTELCFAMVIEEMYTNISLGGATPEDNVPDLLPELKDLPRIDFKFDMNRFL